eukprot:358183-Chlamydomonas_euryale.AAC.1
MDRARTGHRGRREHGGGIREWASAVLGFGGVYHSLIGPETLEESFPFSLVTCGKIRTRWRRS